MLPASLRNRHVARIWCGVGLSQSARCVATRWYSTLRLMASTPSERFARWRQQSRQVGVGTRVGDIGARGCGLILEKTTGAQCRGGCLQTHAGTITHAMFVQAVMLTQSSNCSMMSSSLSAVWWTLVPTIFSAAGKHLRHVTSSRRICVRIVLKSAARSFLWHRQPHTTCCFLYGKRNFSAAIWCTIPDFLFTTSMLRWGYVGACSISAHLGRNARAGCPHIPPPRNMRAASNTHTVVHLAILSHTHHLLLRACLKWPT